MTADAPSSKMTKTRKHGNLLLWHLEKGYPKGNARALTCDLGYHGYIPDIFHRVVALPSFGESWSARMAVVHLGDASQHAGQGEERTVFRGSRGQRKSYLLQIGSISRQP